MTNRTGLSLVLAFLLACCTATAEETPVSYGRDIRPLLAKNCFLCHGPDADSREADLRLDVRAAAIANRDGVAAIVPGDAEKSALVERIASDDEDLRMPPADSGKQLTAAQIALLRKWIDSGAAYERHWALEPVRRPAIPTDPTAERNDYSRCAIDAFVSARLAAAGLHPAAEADRHTLVRRLYLDLLGLLPTIREADEFAADDRPDAYERLVDRLLSSPRLGERWGRHWLDQARYADSHGYTNDNERVMWPFRDWVISALNRDLPFDRFTIEQLAGDLLPNATAEQKIATGFHRNTLINTEGGTKVDQFRDEQVKDRVDTTGGVWLGLTVGCAKCHNHKYDPISQAEYYSLYAFFNSTADSNSVPPTIPAPTAQQQTRLDELDAGLAKLNAELATDDRRSNRQAAWEAELLRRRDERIAGKDTDGANANWTVLELDGKSGSGATIESLEDRSVLVGGENVAGDVYELTARSPLTTIRSVRLEVLTHDNLPHRGPGRAANGNFVLTDFWFRTGDGRDLRFAKAQADHSQPQYDITGAIDEDLESGWAINGSPEGGPNHDRTAWFVLAAPLEVEDGHALTFTVQHRAGPQPYNIGRLRLSISSQEWRDAPSDEELTRLVATPREKRPLAQQKRIDEAFLRGDTKLAPVFATIENVGKMRDGLLSQVASAMVMRELDKPRDAHVQKRGDFLQPAEKVLPDVPDALPGFEPSESIRTRLDLARSLVRVDNPLTPRVRVNRLWMHLFGKGLVETENDFGTQGSLPTHPDLLDWLAAEQIHQSWSTKRMLRLLVASATYRQRSEVRGPGTTADPQNRLLWRQNRIRVEGEIVRDLALSASGLLSDKIGGPSVFPPQPDGVYAFTQRAKNWRTSTGEDRFRRGLYTFFYRSAPYPMLTTFDAPNFNQTCTCRDRSNTPLQSLTVANDASLVELARALAVRVLAEAAADRTEAATIEQLFRVCMVRSPSTAEADFLAKFLREQRTHFDVDGDAAGKLSPGELPAGVSTAEAAAFVATARVVLNLDEFITRE
ncbi:MAG: PSD1 and planctomycete cytochrome C domain-containing protein [Pirellulales bacterium]